MELPLINDRRGWVMSSIGLRALAGTRISDPPCLGLL
jgi:hypothetical protein